MAIEDSHLNVSSSNSQKIAIPYVALIDGSGAAVGSTAPIAVEQPMFVVAGTTLTRPANQTPYSANDSISDNATAGSVTALVATVSDTNDQPIVIEEILVDSTDTGIGGANAAAGTTLRVHIFDADPTASTGVVGGDNAAYSNKKAGWKGSFSGTMRQFSDGSRGRLVPDEGNVLVCKPGTGTKTVWFQFQTLGAFTPSANSTTFIATFKGWQGRLNA